VVLNACRYFGHTRDYWWANLTWPLYEEMEWQLAERPPADQLVADYFRGMKWWAPPERTGCASGAGGDDDDDGEWESPLPDVTD